MNKAIEWGIVAVLVFSPLPAASVHEWSVLVIQAVVLVMVGVYVFMKKKPQNNELLSKSLEIPSYLFWGFFIFLFLQVLPLPKFLVKILSPQTFSFYKDFFPDFSDIHFLSLSVVPSQTLREGIEILVYVLLGSLIIRTVTEKRQMMRLFSVVVVVGVFEVLYGFFELLRSHPRVLFYKKVHFLDHLTGTFVNPNHLSGYLEMAIPLGVGLLMARVGFFGWSRLNFKEKLLWVKESGWVRNGLIFLGIVALVLGIIFSQSRSGVFILILSFVLLLGLALLFYNSFIDEKKGIKTFFIGVFSVVLVFSLYLGIDTTLKKFSLDQTLQEQRPLVWGNTMEMFGDFPVFGSGLGTFGSVYTAYEESGEFVRFSHAHNDYLEYAAELGVLGMIFLFGGILFMLGSAFWVWRERRDPQVKGLSLGGIAALGVVLVHSITDFNLHIPANMVLFSAVLSLTVAAAFYKGEKGKK